MKNGSFLEKKYKAVKEIELLAPAGNLDIGLGAIKYGADAIYIGAKSFGARINVPNSIKDITFLCREAHKYWVKVYVTLNTIIFDSEIKKIEKLVWELYYSGVNAFIIQDLAFTQMNLPPVPLFASTQCDLREVKRVKFFEDLGFKRAILARELSLSQIKSIKQECKGIELEAFVHGSLCVSYSGNCYLSEKLYKRSANRGDCAQICRYNYTLSGKDIKKEKKGHFLSVKDMNRSLFLEEMINAGITSFKIEGRLKDNAYVQNIVALYRKTIDEIIERRDDLKKSSHGKTKINFQPNADKTFNRGYCSYMIKGNQNKKLLSETPKHKGEYIGKIKNIDKNYFVLDRENNLSPGDGISFYKKKNLSGSKIFKVEENRIYPQSCLSLSLDKDIFRNYDYRFYKILKENKSQRKISLFIECSFEKGFVNIKAKDEYGITSQVTKHISSIEPKNKDFLFDLINKSFKKIKESEFEIVDLKLEGEITLLKNSQANELRREVLKEHRNNREKARVKNIPYKRGTSKLYDNKTVDFTFNVSNKLALKAYEDCGAGSIQKAFELSHKHDSPLMKSKFCLRKELNLCIKKSPFLKGGPLYLQSKNFKLKLVFLCDICEMEVYLI